MTNFIYLLHFDQKLHHAQHYLGATTNLEKRLYQHANGTGARITQYLWENGRHWKLAAIWTIDDTAQIFDIETTAKKTHNGRLFCPECNASPRHPKGAQHEAVYHLNFPTTSKELRKCVTQSTKTESTETTEKNKPNFQISPQKLKNK